MNTDPENFDDLKKLLALKRHEQPPPGYFNELPHRIWARIEAQEAQPSFWNRIFSGLALRPAVAYAFGLIVCGTLIFGIGSALKEPQQASVPVAMQPQAAQLPQLGPALADKSVDEFPVQSAASSTNPVILTPDIKVQPANYNP